MNSNRKASNDELDALIGALVNGIATPEETKRLEQLLLSDAEARAYYRRYMNLHVALRGLSGAAMSPPKIQANEVIRASTVPALPPARVVKVRRHWLILAVGAAAAAIAFAFLGAPAQPGISPTKQPALARISRSFGARWTDDAQSASVGAQLNSGVFELSNGLIELRMDGEATILLQAPVRFELKASRRVVLRNGQIVVHADKAKGDFIVETAHTTVTDLGTEFGVGVDPTGDTQVQVFQGKVVADWKTQDGKSAGSQQIVAGQAFSIENTSGINARNIPFTEDRFIRTFPEDDKVNPVLAVFNKTALETIQVVAAPESPPTIDGDLADWNMSGQFHSACVEPYDKTYFIDGAMMYDAQNLYIGAHVGDPYPMRNSRDVAADPALIWEGGSVVVRLSTDAALGWPLQGHSKYVGDYRGDPLNGRRPQDTSDNIVHLIMWYDKRAEQPRLALEFGLDYHGRTDLPEGWRGVFKKDSAELGYTLEYAIPWKLLNSKGAPRAGDVLATAWLVHWSDKQGIRPRGYLVEFKNPSEPRVDMLWGKSWGKAVIRPKGDPAP